MLPTFVIGLREGLEAALIVGIIAAFLRKQGRMDLLRWVFAGVAVAVVLCIGVGVVLEVVSRDLPQKQQEGLETVVGALAVLMVTYMVLWMKRHSRELKGTLEQAAAAAMADGGSKAGRAMVLMAFLSVLREGFETVVFLLAAFNESNNNASAGTGAALGIAVAVFLGWGIYRGGVRLNLSKFFRATGLVLVLVAAGLVVTALHTAHEAGWLNAGQGSTFSLNWLVRPGSVESSLLTGMLGLQPYPVVVEVAGWLLYVIPVGLFVAWPPSRALSRAKATRVAGVVGAAAGIAAIVLAVVMPGTPTRSPVTAGAGLSVRATSAPDGRALTLNSTGADPTNGRFALAPAGFSEIGGLQFSTYSSSVHSGTNPAMTKRMTAAAIAKLNGGRLPVGLNGGLTATYRVTFSTTTAVSATVDPTTNRVINASWSSHANPVVHVSFGAEPLTATANRTKVALPANATAAALTAAHQDRSAANRRSNEQTIAVMLGIVAVLTLLGTGGSVISGRRSPDVVDSSTQPLVGHQVSLT